MSFRQYVGARYVTKIYENSVDPSTAEWEANVNYEPLTMVTYNNGSYLSKKTVPANIGNPASNPNFWVQTGFYNGQIASLQSQIDTINNITIPAIQNDISDIYNKIDHIDNRQFIVICDSYGERVNGDGNNFYVQAFIDLGITDYYDFHRGSAGFSRTGYTNFLTVLTDNESAISDKTKITDIIVAGGANDQLDVPNINPGISDFMDYVKVNYPNATVRIGHFTNSIDQSYASTLVPSIEKYRDCQSYGASYIDHSEFVMAKLSFFENDAVHPSASGQAALTKYFKQYILEGTFDVIEKATNTLSAIGTDTTLVSDDLSFEQFNNLVYIRGSSGGNASFNLNFSPAKSMSAGQTTMGDMLQINDGFFYATATNNPAFDFFAVTSPNVMAYHAEMYVGRVGTNKEVKAGLIFFNPSSISAGSVQTTIGPRNFNLFGR